MHIATTSGAARVVASDMVTTFMGKPLAVALELDDGALFVLGFAFHAEADGAELRVDGQESPGKLVLHCFNFDDATGRGSATPVQITSTEHTAYYLHFRVFLFGKTEDRTLHYTVYAVPR